MRLRERTPLIEVGLVANRHKMPVTDYVFDYVEDVTDFAFLQDTAEAWVAKHVSVKTMPLVVRLYVSGLSSALAAFLQAWDQKPWWYFPACKPPERRPDTELVLMHWDREAGEYIPQPWKVRT